MIFRATLEPEKTPADQRSTARKRLRLGTFGGRASREASEVLVHDLSAEGLLIESADSFESGEQLAIELPRSGAHEAVVVWSSTNFYGCRFVRPLTPAEMSAALLKAQPPGQPEAPRAPDAEAPFPERLAALRRARGWSMERLASKLGVSRQSVWYWESGKRRPKRAMLARIAERLAVSEHELVEPAPQNELAAPDLRLWKTRLAERLGVPAESVRILVEL